MKMKVLCKDSRTKETAEKLVRFFQLDEFEWDREIQKEDYYVFSKKHDSGRVDFCVEKEVDQETAKSAISILPSSFVVFLTTPTGKTAKEFARRADSIQFINIEKEQIHCRKEFRYSDTALYAEFLLNQGILKAKISFKIDYESEFKTVINEFFEFLFEKEEPQRESEIENYPQRFYYNTGEKSLKIWFLNNCLKAVVQDGLRCEIDERSRIKIYDEELLFKIEKFSYDEYGKKETKYIQYLLYTENIKKEYTLLKFLRRLNRNIRFEKRIPVQIDERFAGFKFLEERKLEKNFGEITAMVDVQKETLTLTTECELRYRTIQKYMEKIDEIQNQILEK